MAQMYMVTVTHPGTSDIAPGTIVYRSFMWTEGVTADIVKIGFREALWDTQPEYSDFPIRVRGIEPGDPEVRPEDMPALRREALRGLMEGPVRV